MDFTGDDIRSARERAHLTQQELGEAVGVSLRTIGNWERGESVPRSRMAALIEVLGLDDSGYRATFPAGGIQNLIVEKKGERSYERLARDCGYDIKNRALQAAATKVTRGFADPDTIKGLSRGLNVPVAHIIRAYAVSLGLPIAEDEKGTLQIVGGANLPRSSQDILINMAQELRHAYETPAEVDYSDRYDLAAKQADANIDPEEDQP